MAIWFGEIERQFIRERGKGTLIETLGIELVEIGDDYLKARMPVDHRTRQPYGLLHGGASVALAETLATLGAYYCVDRGKYACVGLEINANHMRPVAGGYVTGIARPAHLGRTTHVWEVRITDDKDKLVCLSRVSIAIVPAPTGQPGG